MLATVQDKAKPFKTQTYNCMDIAVCDTLSLEELQSLVEGRKKEMTRKEILSKHTSPIKQLPNGRWYTRINGKKIERKEKSDLESAIIAAARNNDITLVTQYDGYLTCRKHDVADTSWQKDIRNYDFYIKDSKLANIPLKDITITNGHEFLDHCLRVYPDMKHKYWKGVLGTLNSMFRYAIDQNYIEKNPFINLKPKADLFKEATKTSDGDSIFSKEESAAVLELAEEDALNTGTAIPLGIVLLFNLGIRDGELCPLKWSDIEDNFRGEYIHIQREMTPKIDKNGKAHGFEILPHCKSASGDRRLLLNSKAKETFEKIRSYNQKNGIPTELDDYIFIRKQNGVFNTCTPRCFDPRLRKYCKKAGMSVIKSPHDVRRTVLTNLYLAGMPLKQVQKYAGHASLQQTMDYLRIADDDDCELIQYLEKLA